MPMGFVFQSFNLVPTLTALENVSLAGEYAGVAARQGARRGHGALWAGSAWPSVTTIGRWSSPAASSSASPSLARSSTHPMLLLADEPTGNLDSAHEHEVLALLRRFNRERGQTLVMVTHDPDVGAVCDRIIHMRDGLCERSESLVTSHPAVEASSEAAT